MMLSDISRSSISVFGGHGHGMGQKCRVCGVCVYYEWAGLGFVAGNHIVVSYDPRFAHFCQWHD